MVGRRLAGVERVLDNVFSLPDQGQHVKQHKKRQPGSRGTAVPA